MAIEDRYKESREAPLYKATERLLWEVDDTLNYLSKDRRHTLGHGVKFTGGVIKHNRIYAGNRTVANAYDLVREYNRIRNKEKYIEQFAQRYNSYMGYMIHKQTYAIRWRIWNELDDSVKKYVYVTNGLAVMKVRNQCKTINKYKEQYGKTNRKQERIQRDRGCIYA